MRAVHHVCDLCKISLPLLLDGCGSCALDTCMCLSHVCVPEFEIHSVSVFAAEMN